MLLDLRTYRCKPGTINKHLELYEKYGKEPQFRCLGEPLCYLRTETGDPNEYVHIWVYENAGDREAKRAKIAAGSEVEGGLCLQITPEAATQLLAGVLSTLTRSLYAAERTLFNQAVAWAENSNFGEDE